MQVSGRTYMIVSGKEILRCVVHGPFDGLKVVATVVFLILNTVVKLP